MERAVIDEAMRDYYERRAGEYDDWWLGLGQFATLDRPGWTGEVERLTALLRSLPPARVLDVACGTGFLTQHLRGEIVGLDQSASMVEIASQRTPAARVLRGEATPLPFEADAFDRVLSSHFYGHLLPEERDAFLREARRVAQQLVIVDSAARADTERELWQERRLDDGSVHDVYKRYFTGEDLVAELGGGEILHEGRWFVVVAA